MNVAHQINNLIQIQKVNTLDGEITSPVSLRTLHNNKGRAVFLRSTESINTVAVLEFVPQADARGNHYHHHRQESIYIIKGKLKLFLWLPDSPEIEERIVESGDLITLQPKLGHSYKAIDHTWAFEMGSCGFDPSDTVLDERVIKMTADLTG